MKMVLFKFTTNDKKVNRQLDSDVINKEIQNTTIKDQNVHERFNKFIKSRKTKSRSKKSEKHESKNSTLSEHMEDNRSEGRKCRFHVTDDDDLVDNDDDDDDIVDNDGDDDDDDVTNDYDDYEGDIHNHEKHLFFLYNNDNKNHHGVMVKKIEKKYIKDDHSVKKKILRNENDVLCVVNNSDNIHNNIMPYSDQNLTHETSKFCDKSFYNYRARYHDELISSSSYYHLLRIYFGMKEISPGSLEFLIFSFKTLIGKEFSQHDYNNDENNAIFGQKKKNQSRNFIYYEHMRKNNRQRGKKLIDSACNMENEEIVNGEEEFIRSMSDYYSHNHHNIAPDSEINEKKNLKSQNSLGKNTIKLGGSKQYYHNYQIFRDGNISAYDEDNYDCGDKCCRNEINKSDKEDNITLNNNVTFDETCTTGLSAGAEDEDNFTEQKFISMTDEEKCFELSDRNNNNNRNPMHYSNRLIKSDSDFYNKSSAKKGALKKLFSLPSHINFNLSRLRKNNSLPRSFNNNANNIDVNCKNNSLIQDRNNSATHKAVVNTNNNNYCDNIASKTVDTCKSEEIRFYSSNYKSHPNVPSFFYFPSTKRRLILVSFDMSVSSGEEISWIRNHVLRPGDSVILFHAAPNFFVRIPSDYTSPGMVLMTNKDLNDHNYRVFEKLRKKMRSFYDSYLRDCDVFPFIVPLSKNSKTCIGSLLCAVGRELSVDLIILGYHNHHFSYVRQLLFGSITKYVFEHSNCPVLFVKNTH